MSDVFISYSRDDKAFVALLREAFLKQSQEVWIDWESIPASQTWWDEIKRGIATANNFMVVMSPNSLSSPICHLEIEYARSLGKRIIPVFHVKPDREACLMGITKRLANTDSSQDITRDLWGNRQPHTIFDDNQKALAPINYFFFTPDDNFDEKFDQLLAIIRTDFKHKEIHTRIGLRANQWANRDRDVSFLLNGQELKDAEAWLDEALASGKNPPLTDLQTDYIRAGRATEDKNAQYLRDMEAERQKLADDVASERVKLTDVENARVKLTKRVRGIAIIAGIILIVALIALLVGVNAINNTAIAQNEFATSEANLNVVNTQVIFAQATVTQVTIRQNLLNAVSGAMILNRDDFDAQLRDLNSMVERYPDNYESWFWRGLAYLEAGRYEEAIADYDRAIVLNPQDAIDYNNRGLAYHYLGEYDKAIADYTQTITLNPQYIIAYTNRGNAYSTLGNYDQAIADYTQAITLNPQGANAYYNRGLTYYNLGDTDRAIADYTQAITLNPQFTLAYYNRGNAYYYLAEYENAIADYTQAITLNSQFAIAYNNRGDAYYNLAKYENATADYDQAVTLNPQLADAYQRLGIDYEGLGNYEEALINYSRAITLNPQYSDAYIGRGNAYYYLGEYDKAITDYTQTITLNPQYSDAYYNRGLAYHYLAKNEPDVITQQGYAHKGVDDFRMAELLGLRLNSDTQQLLMELEAMLTEIAPTPNP